jgi:hypothetical protein
MTNANGNKEAKCLTSTTYLCNSSKQKDPVSIYITQVFTVALYKRMKISGEHTMSECIICDLSFSLVFLCALIADTNSIFITL